MPLLLLDLDDTLVERTAGLEAWVRDLVLRFGGDEGDVSAVMKVDARGTAPRDLVIEELRTRAGLTAPTDELVMAMRAGIARRIMPDVRVLGALARARAAGWACVAVTNGLTEQQARTIQRAGLDARLDAWVISEQVGVRKPDPAIFALAAARVGGDLDGAWMIGDSPSADIAGAHGCGVRSVWLHRGRDWPTSLTPAAAQADSLPEAVDHVLAAGH